MQVVGEVVEIFRLIAESNNLLTQLLVFIMYLVTIVLIFRSRARIIQGMFDNLNLVVKTILTGLVVVGSFWLLSNGPSLAVTALFLLLMFTALIIAFAFITIQAEDIRPGSAVAKSELSESAP